MKVLLCLFILAMLPAHGALDPSHQAFTAVLEKVVKGDSVDYESLKEDPDALGSYLVSLSEVPEEDFKQWDDSKQIAFLINLYNASTLKLIVDSYPVKSIKDIRSPWGQNRVKVFGKAVSLDHVENNLLRENHQEPRIHFALNCASIGCPPLRAEAYTGENLESQLTSQTRSFLSNEKFTRYDPATNVLVLSPIFKWFEKDFLAKSESILKFVTPYLPETAAKALKAGNTSVQYGEYDWSLNNT